MLAAAHRRRSSALFSAVVKTGARTGRRTVGEQPMLAPDRRLRSSALFSAVVKKGARKGSRTVVVHLWTPEPGLDAPLELTGGPRAGLIVSKAVGNAVVRHAVSRRLRAVL